MNNLSRISPKGYNHAPSEPQSWKSSVEDFKNKFGKFIENSEVDRSKAINTILQELDSYSKDSQYFSASNLGELKNTFLQMIIGDDHTESLKIILQSQQAVGSLKEWLNLEGRFTAAALHKRFNGEAPVGQGAKKNFYFDRSLGKGFTQVRDPKLAAKEYESDMMLKEYLGMFNIDDTQMKMISLLDVVKDGNNQATQWAAATSKGSKLTGQVNSKAKTAIDSELAKKLAIAKFNQLLLIAKFLFDKGLAHGDLHLENLKERDDRSVAAFDFGLVKIGASFTASPLFDFQYLLKGGNHKRQLATHLSKMVAPTLAAKHDPLKKILLDGGFSKQMVDGVMMECENQFKKLETTYKNLLRKGQAFQNIQTIEIQGNKYSVSLPSQEFSDAVRLCIEAIMGYLLSAAA